MSHFTQADGARHVVGQQQQLLQQHHPQHHPQHLQPFYGAAAYQQIPGAPFSSSDPYAQAYSQAYSQHHMLHHAMQQRQAAPGAPTPSAAAAGASALAADTSMTSQALMRLAQQRGTSPAPPSEPAGYQQYHDRLVSSQEAGPRSRGMSNLPRVETVTAAGAAGRPKEEGSAAVVKTEADAQVAAGGSSWHKPSPEKAAGQGFRSGGGRCVQGAVPECVCCCAADGCWLLAGLERLPACCIALHLCSCRDRPAGIASCAVAAPPEGCWSCCPAWCWPRCSLHCAARGRTTTTTTTLTLTPSLTPLPPPPPPCRATPVLDLSGAGLARPGLQDQWAMAAGAWTSPKPQQGADTQPRNATPQQHSERKQASIKQQQREQQQQQQQQAEQEQEQEQQAEQQAGDAGELSEDDFLERIKKVPTRTRTGIIPRGTRQQRSTREARGSARSLALNFTAKGMAKGAWPSSFEAGMHPSLPFSAAWPSAATRPGRDVPVAGALAGYPAAAAFVQQGGRDLVVEVVPAGGKRAAAAASSDDEEEAAPSKRARSSVRRAGSKASLQVAPPEQEEQQEEEEQEEGGAASDGGDSPQGIDALLHAAELFSKLEEEA